MPSRAAPERVRKRRKPENVMPYLFEAVNVRNAGRNRDTMSEPLSLRISGGHLAIPAGLTTRTNRGSKKK